MLPKWSSESVTGGAILAHSGSATDHTYQSNQIKDIRSTMPGLSSSPSGQRDYFTSRAGNPHSQLGTWDSWEAPSFSKVRFRVAADWDGRIWDHRDCDFSSNLGPNSSMNQVCALLGGTVVPPATSAEFNMDCNSVSDFYDVSRRIQPAVKI
ncbi:hypothetical protein B0H11DRAFT_2290065 [Mycena galericulata]|nr:hypothetical protein B0H11DRAFT_2295911 [Mycena galericulata]KAJ7447730.1 hypothetical protein B0H11DRAFT_2290065 [Mycena galericulata]